MTAGRAVDDPTALPAGWSGLATEHAAGLVERLQWEISRDHLLAGVAVEAVARRDANDDVLYRHVADPSRYSVVHLTWASRPETTPFFPSVEFDGTFAGFVESERRLAADRDR
ncbi:MAG: hypothetical protein ACT4N2_04380 [Hyphomicrobium sp.]